MEESLATRAYDIACKTERREQKLLASYLLYFLREVLKKQAL
jgi:hypothetical protein